MKHYISCIASLLVLLLTCVSVTSLHIKHKEVMPIVIEHTGEIPYTYLGEFNITHYTHTGNRCRNGHYPTLKTVAVDPNVIPLNSLLYIEGYGLYVAMDTGGAIKGNRLDVFVDTHEEAIQKGYSPQHKVYILEDRQ